MWNINANIVFADILSTAATALVIDAIQQRLSTPLINVIVTAIVDGAISIAIFAALHIYGNRARGIHDLLRVQIHRWFLSPLHYLVGTAMQYTLLKMEVRVGIAVLVAYLSAVAIVRIAHTLYGKKSGLFR
jgi:hypothetical protein